MRYILLFILFTTFSLSDDIKRIESIVEDISKLRTQYKKCENELEIVKASGKEDEFFKLKNLKNQIKIYKNLVKSKDKIIISLRNKKNKIKYKKIIKTKIIEKKISDKPNGFPRLILKDRYYK